MLKMTIPTGASAAARRERWQQCARFASLLTTRAAHPSSVKDEEKRRSDEEISLSSSFFFFFFFFLCTYRRVNKRNLFLLYAHLLCTETSFLLWKKLKCFPILSRPNKKKKEKEMSKWNAHSRSVGRSGGEGMDMNVNNHNNALVVLLCCESTFPPWRRISKRKRNRVVAEKDTSKGVFKKRERKGREGGRERSELVYCSSGRG